MYSAAIYAALQVQPGHPDWAAWSAMREGAQTEPKPARAARRRIVSSSQHARAVQLDRAGLQPTARSSALASVVHQRIGCWQIFLRPNSSLSGPLAPISIAQAREAAPGKSGLLQLSLLAARKAGKVPQQRGGCR